MSSAGALQLAVTGALLEAKGCTLWDLGMGMKYKYEMGARSVPREQFVALFENAKGTLLSMSQENEERATKPNTARRSVMEFSEFQTADRTNRHEIDDLVRNFYKSRKQRESDVAGPNASGSRMNSGKGDCGEVKIASDLQQVATAGMSGMQIAESEGTQKKIPTMPRTAAATVVPARGEYAASKTKQQSKGQVIK